MLFHTTIREDVRFPGRCVGRAEPAQDMEHSRFAFIALCCYLVTQVIYVPVLPFGPSWAVWPAPSDFAVILLAVSIPFGYLRVRKVSKPAGRLFRLLFIVLLGMAFSYLITSLQSAISIGGDQKQSDIGLFQIFQFAKFVLVFWVAAGIPLSDSRLRILANLVDAVFLLVFLGIIGTYTSVLETYMFVGHLPPDPGISGPWASLFRDQPDVGTMGYNHAYVALQLIMLSSLSMSLRPLRGSVVSAIYLMLAGVGTFLSGSRAGMVALLLLLTAFFVRKPVMAFTIAIFGAILFLAGPSLMDNPNLGIETTAQRYTALRNPLQFDSLSGRPQIWGNAYNLLAENPVRWVIGAGPGIAALIGSNAHMLYLHILVEAGLIGLAVFFYIMHKIITYLARHEEGTKPILVATFAFLVSSLTQETFYPIPAFGHFLGLYLCALGIVFARTRTADSMPAYRRRRNA